MTVVNANHLITHGFQFEGLVSPLTSMQNAFAYHIEKIADAFGNRSQDLSNLQNLAQSQSNAGVTPKYTHQGAAETGTKSILS